MNYNYSSLGFDAHSRPTSRAASPQPHLPPLAQSAPAPRYPAPTAASFGPSYYSRPAAPQPQPLATDLGHRSAPTMNSHAPTMMHSYQPSAVPQAVPSAAPSMLHNDSYGRYAQPLSMAPRGANQPPRNSMEMVHDALDQWKSKLETEQQQMAALEEEERRLDQEEQMMRRRMMDLQSQNRAIDQIMLSTQRGWSTLYEQEHDLRMREQDPANNEERVLCEKIAIAEQRTQQCRIQHHEIEQRAALVRADLGRLAHVEARQKEQDEQLNAIVSAFERLSARRQVTKAKCDKYYDIESQRESCARNHLATISRDAVADGEIGGGATQSMMPAPSRAGSSALVKSAPAPVPLLTADDDEAGAEEMDLLLGGGLAMDSVCLSVCNNTKKRRLESQPMSRHNSMAPISAF